MLSPIKAICGVAFVAVASFALAETTYPLTIEDGMGNTLVISSEPTSVSSKTLFTDEILLDMLEPEKLSSLTNVAKEKHYSNIANQLPDGVPLLDLNVEAVLGNGPDIVFAANWSDAGVVEQLKQAGIVVYLVNTPFTLKGIEQEIRKIGRILNAETAANEIVNRMQNRLDALSNQTSKISSSKIVALDYNPWGTASGAATTWNAVLSESGLINGSAEFEQGPYGQVAMSKELVIEIDPDVLFLPGWIYGDNDGANAFLEQVKNDPALSGVKAVRLGQVYQVPEALRGTYSQYIIDTIEFVVESVLSTDG